VDVECGEVVGEGDSDDEANSDADGDLIDLQVFAPRFSPCIITKETTCIVEFVVVDFDE